MSPENAQGRRRPAGCEAAGDGGFTLIELMVVVALLGVLLLVIPPRLDGWGARSRLESSGNSLVSAFTGAREQAIIDGNPVVVLFDVERNVFGYRVMNRTHRSPKELQERSGQSRTEEEIEEEQREEEWVDTPWTALPDGIHIRGFSTLREQWAAGNNGGEPWTVTFFPDGSVRPAPALLIEGDRDLPDASRFLTVTVNALTSLAEVQGGKIELPPKRSPDEFK